MRENLEKIKEYYERVWKCIVEDDFKGATNILYREMPIKLYDLSLNILYNNETTSEELQNLIRKVDNALVEESMDEDSVEDNDEDILEESEIKDEFNGNF